MKLTLGKVLPLTGVEGVDLANLALLVSSDPTVKVADFFTFELLPASISEVSGRAVRGVIVGSEFLKEELTGGIGMESFRGF